MKYIIMAGGVYPAWETPRQLTQIRGEPLVGRTIRLLKEAGVDDIAISTHDERFNGFGVPLLHHENTFHGYEGGMGTWVEAFYPMEDAACYLMGDVLFSPEAIKKIVETETDSIAFFASAPPFDHRYIKQYAEPFGFKIADQKAFRSAIETVKALEKSGAFLRRPIAWELWQVIQGTPLNTIVTDYTVINDYTCDIDRMEDAERLRGITNE